MRSFGLLPVRPIGLTAPPVRVLHRATVYRESLDQLSSLLCQALATLELSAHICGDCQVQTSAHADILVLRHESRHTGKDSGPGERTIWGEGDHKLSLSED